MRIFLSILVLGLELFALQTIKVTQAQQDDLGIRLQEVQRIDTIEFGPFSGVVVLDKKDIISISANVESVITNIHVGELEHVQKGQKLLTFKSNALLSIQLEYIEAMLEKESAAQNYNRDIKLQADGIISNKKLLESKKIKQRSDVSAHLAKNKLLTSGFTSAMLKQLLRENTPIAEITLYASRSGVVHSINANIGEYVLSEHKIIEMYADGKRFIEMTVPVKDIQNISLSETVTFDTFSAKVSAIGNVVNTSSQSVIVRATINEEKNIMIHRVYEAKISKKVQGAFKVKKTALVFDENKSFVFRKVANGFEVLEVEIIKEGPVCYIVKADIKATDEVAASSTSALLSAKEGDSE